MAFNTMEYLIFLPVVLLVYYLIPDKVRYIWLCIASYYFYMQWNAVYALLLFACTFISYLGAIFLEKNRDNTKAKKWVLAISIVLILSLLAYYKYFDFTVDLINRAIGHLGMSPITYSFSIILPVGVSFYTLQSIGYLIDVYRGNIYVEKNLIRYAVFVSFFPQLVAGPIERSKNLLVQLGQKHEFDWDNISRGCIMIIYGLFVKMVIADRAATMIDTVFDAPDIYRGWYCVIAALLFPIQVYCDFYGYSVIAKGSAKCLGIDLMDNFNAPFMSVDIPNLWRRWHISLTSWFTDYIYIPLGGSRKGTARKRFNLMLIFIISGLWHGAAIHYVMWGFVNGIYQIVCDIKRKFHKDHHTEPLKIPNAIRIAFVYLLFAFSTVFFRADNMSNAIAIFTNGIHLGNYSILFDGSIANMGVTMYGVLILAIAVVILTIVDFLKYKNHNVLNDVMNMNWIVRMILVVGLTVIVMLYGCYGEIYDMQQFIYFQF